MLVLALSLLFITAPAPSRAVPPYEAEGLELVAITLDARAEAPLNNVWIHGDYAYVGGLNPGYWNSPRGDVGVRILDISKPEEPVLVARIPLGAAGWKGNDAPQIAGNAAVAHLETDAFVGDVAAVTNGVPEGTSVSSTGNAIGIWDVTDPTSPQLLSHLEFGRMPHFEDEPHMTSLGGTLLFAIHGTGKDELSTYGHIGGTFRSSLGVADLSDPRNPVIKGVWNDAENKIAFMSMRANAGGTRVYLAGMYPPPYGRSSKFGVLVILDTTDPANPTEIGRYTYDLLGVPVTPVAVPHASGDLVILSDGSWQSGRWGYLHIIDTSDLSDIREISTFKLPESDQPRGDDFYPLCVEIEVQGDLVYSTWYNAGLHVVDISDPAQPVEVGHFEITGSYPFLQGVFPRDDLVLTTHPWNSGLYILRLNGWEAPTAVVESADDERVPEDFSLLPNYPNPFNSGTAIRFSLPHGADTELSVYSLAGQQMMTLVDGWRGAGAYTVHWDGRDHSGEELASGVYLYRLQAGQQRVETRKLLLLR